jgi:hypothetical protein
LVQLNGDLVSMKPQILHYLSVESAMLVEGGHPLPL